MKRRNAPAKCPRLRRTLSGFVILATFVATVLFSALMTPASAQTTVKVWLHEHPPRVAIDKAIIAEFEKANPDIKIQYDVIPVGEYGQNS